MKLRHLLPVVGVALTVACHDPVSRDGDHARDVAGVEIFDRADPAVRLARTVGQGASSEWEGSLPALRAGDTRTLDVRWVDGTGRTLALSTRYATRVRFAADARDTGAEVRENQVLRLASDGGGAVLTGRAAGVAEVVVVLWHGSHDDWVSAPLRVQVTAP